jgi:hypothetical protein
MPGFFYIWYMKVADILDRQIFWDINPEKLDWQKNRQFIIERVLTRGFTNDVRCIFKIYTKKELQEAVLKSKVLDKKTANFMSNYLNIPYSRIHVAPEHY